MYTTRPIIVLNREDPFYVTKHSAISHKGPASSIHKYVYSLHVYVVN